MVDEISPKDLAARLERGDRPILLDVRQAEELAIVKLDGVTHIPLDELTSRANELDPDGEIVCICHHGMRSMSAATFLESRDFTKVINLTGGMDAWANEVDPTLPRY